MLYINRDTSEIVGHSKHLIEGWESNPDCIVDPVGFTWERRHLWKLNETLTGAIKKTGSDLEDALEIVQPSIRGELLKKYAGAALNPTTLGNLEGATDILVYFLNKWVNSESLSSDEITKWNSFYGKVSPNFKISLEDLPLEEDALAGAKALARQVEIDLKNDPDWNIS